MNRLESVQWQGEAAVIKRNAKAPEGFFAAEAAGLEALSDAGWWVPRVLDCAADRLVLEAIDTGRPRLQSWQQAGTQLAHQHQSTQTERFGFHLDTYCGDSRQPNDWSGDGYAFYQQHRYQPQLQRARDAQRLSRAEVTALERLIDRLGDWLPNEAPALLHGDLWSGNLLFERSGAPVLIDPACYYGWPEADLAMTHAFGGFDPAFYQAYQTERPLAPGFDEREPLYNLYHWLNHLNLFGGAYHGAVVAVIDRYLGQAH